jgi:hypothetical protein
MCIWGCGSPAIYCQPAAAAGFISCRSQEWALHSPNPSLWLFRVLLDTCPFCFLLYTALQTCCNCSLFLFRVFVEKWPSPFSSGACETLATVTRLLLSKHTGGGGATPTFSSHLFYLQFVWGSAHPHSPVLRVLSPLCYVSFVFFSCLFSIQFFVFQSGGQSVHGAMLLYPRGGCGGTMCHLSAHLVVCVSQVG